MPTLIVQTFAAARELIGNPVEVTLDTGSTVQQFRSTLLQQYPALNELSEFAVALNEEYATDEETLQTGDTIVIIPPVSGG